VITHLHWDHIGNLEATGNAPLLVPATELAFWRLRGARHRPFFAHTYAPGLETLDAADAAGRMRTFGGVATLAPGVTAFEVGGHCPGQIVLLVQTAERPVLLCSDAVHSTRSWRCGAPCGPDSLQAMYAGYELVDALVADLGAVAVPGHDPLVIERFPAENIDANAVRIA
jgi:glyoxylase-like metal-dependent hydrolase (beta-lactamase superfamily II)